MKFGSQWTHTQPFNIYRLTRKKKRFILSDAESCLSSRDRGSSWPFEAIWSFGFYTKSRHAIINTASIYIYQKENKTGTCCSSFLLDKPESGRSAWHSHCLCQHKYRFKSVAKDVVCYTYIFGFNILDVRRNNNNSNEWCYIFAFYCVRAWTDTATWNSREKTP